MENKRIPVAEARRLIRDLGPELARRYDEGESYASIARSLGVSKSAVTKAVGRFGGTPRPRGTYTTPGLAERAADVRRRYEGGESLRSIASDLGLSFTTVRNDLIVAGGETRSVSGFAHTPLRGSENPAWRGGVHLNREGYRMVWIGDDHPFASMRGSQPYVFEHRLVMAESLGRPLARSETVHHINGDRADNRLENLQLRSTAHGQGGRFVCNDCGSHNVSAVSL